MASSSFISQALGEKVRDHRLSTTASNTANPAGSRSVGEASSSGRVLRVRICTLNINGEDLPDDVGSMVGIEDECRDTCCGDEHCRCPDILVFCFQESMKLSVRRVAKDLFSGRHREKHCEKIREHLIRNIPTRYSECHAEEMVGLFTIAFCTSEALQSLQYAQSAIVARGLAGLGNKGAIGIRLRFNNVTFVFVNAHLAASEDETERRNEDMEAIGDYLTFPAPPIDDHHSSWANRSSKGLVAGYVEDKSMITDPLDTFQPERETREEADHRFTIFDSDYLFVAGDLNYRIALTHEEVLKLIQKGDYPMLLQHDQLRQEREQGHVFKKWSEAPIHFRPTYKFDKSSDPQREYDTSEKRRTPSYTDRILYHLADTALSSDVKVEQYTSHEDILCSDHLPVSLTLRIGRN